MIHTNPLKVKTQHEAAGGGWPRPRRECFECKGELVLCYGEIYVNPCWRHINSDCSWNGHGSEGESEIHENAKLKLVESLNKGVKMEVSTDCTLCSRVTTDIMPSMYYRDEVWAKNERGICVWDVAGMVDGKVEVGIEVRYSHEATNIEPRSDVWWVELKAESILTSSEPRYTNIRRNQVCSNRIKCEAKLKEIEGRIDALAIRLGYFKNGVWSTFFSNQDKKAWQPFLDLGRCIKCKKISHDVMQWKPMCPSCYQEVFDIERQVFHELAKKLGFFDGTKWKLVDTPDETIKTELDALLDRKICIVCARWYGRLFKPDHPPFCDKCFDTVIPKPSPPVPPPSYRPIHHPESIDPPPIPIFILDPEKTGYFANGKWYKTRAKRPMIGKLVSTERRLKASAFDVPKWRRRRSKRRIVRNA